VNKKSLLIFFRLRFDFFLYRIIFNRRHFTLTVQRLWLIKHEENVLKSHKRVYNKKTLINVCYKSGLTLCLCAYQQTTSYGWSPVAGDADSS